MWKLRWKTKKFFFEKKRFLLVFSHVELTLSIFYSIISAGNVRQKKGGGVLLAYFGICKPISLGVAESEIPLAVVLTGAVNVLATVIAIFIIEKAGRRKLILIPCLIIALIYLFLTTCLVVKVSTKFDKHF